MDADLVIEVGQRALLTAMMTAGPVLLTALIIGLVVGMVQAATQIQEMTLSFIPKLMGMALALSYFGGYMLELLVSFTRSLYESIPALIG